MMKITNKHKNKNKLSIIIEEKYQKIPIKDEKDWRTKLQNPKSNKAETLNNGGS